jgi:hypothetical protein
MLQFMYGRDYRLPFDDAPRPFWILWERPKDSDELATEQIRTSIETGIWSHSPEVLQRLRDERSHLVEACYVVSICFAYAKTWQNCEYKVLDCFPAGVTEYPVFNPGIKSALESIVSNAYDVASRTYRDGPHQPVGTEDCIVHAKVYSLADKYFVKSLKETARDKFESCMRDSFAGSVFYDAVEAVFTTTPDTDAGLRDLVIRRISEEKKNCCLAANPDLDKALKEYNHCEARDNVTCLVGPCVCSFPISSATYISLHPTSLSSAKKPNPLFLHSSSYSLSLVYLLDNTHLSHGNLSRSSYLHHVRSRRYEGLQRLQVHPLLLDSLPENGLTHSQDHLQRLHPVSPSPTRSGPPQCHLFQP